MPRPGPTGAARLEREVIIFNLACPVGSPVSVRLDSGEVRDTVTRSNAQVLSGHSAVIWLEGISGYYLLDRVSPKARAA